MDSIYSKFEASLAEEYVTISDYRKFVFDANYALDLYNRSGQIFYNHELANYINALVDFLADDIPVLEEVEVFLTRNTSLNAFASDFNYMYINIGLLARVQNEEQLLTVLAHELGHIHYRHSHSFEAFLESVEDKSLDEREEAVLFMKHSRRRGHEFEADQFGFNLLQEKNVDLVKCLTTFDLLEYDQNSPRMGMKDLRILAASDSIAQSHLHTKWQNIQLDYDSLSLSWGIDSLSTHPSVNLRRDSILATTDVFPDLDGKFWSSGKFNFSRNLAISELLQCLLEEGQNVMGISLCVDELQQMDSPELRKLAAKFITRLAQSKYRGDEFDQFLNPPGLAMSDSIDWKFRHLLLDLSPQEMNALGILNSESIEHLDSALSHDLRNLHLQMLYEYNPMVFTATDTTISLDPSTWQVLPGLPLNTMQPFIGLDSLDQVLVDSIVNLGAIWVDDRIDSTSAQFLEQFTNSHLYSTNFSAYREAYEEQLDAFARTLRATDVVLSLNNPDEILGDSGEYEDVRCRIRKNHKLIIIDVLTYAYSENDLGVVTFNSELSAKLNDNAIENLLKYFNVDAEDILSGGSTQDVESLDRYRVYSTWCDELFQFEETSYSAVQDSFQQYSIDGPTHGLIIVHKLNTDSPQSRRGTMDTHCFVFSFGNIEPLNFTSVTKLFPNDYKTKGITGYLGVRKKVSVKSNPTRTSIVELSKLLVE